MLCIDMKMHVHICINLCIHKARRWCIQVAPAKEVLRIAAPDSGTISTAPCTLVGSLLGWWFTLSSWDVKIRMWKSAWSSEVSYGFFCWSKYVQMSSVLLLILCLLGFGEFETGGLARFVFGHLIRAAAGIEVSSPAIVISCCPCLYEQWFLFQSCSPQIYHKVPTARKVAQSVKVLLDFTSLQRCDGVGSLIFGTET